MRNTIIRLSPILLHLNLILLQAHRGLLWYSSQQRKESTTQPRDLPTSSHTRCFWMYVTVWLWGSQEVTNMQNLCEPQETAWVLVTVATALWGSQSLKWIPCPTSLSLAPRHSETPQAKNWSWNLRISEGEAKEVWTIGAECRKNGAVLELPSTKRRWLVKKRTNGLQMLLGYEWIRDVLKQHDEKTKHKRLAWSQNTWQWSVFSKTAAISWKELELLAYSSHRCSLDTCYVHSKF